MNFKATPLKRSFTLIEVITCCVLLGLLMSFFAVQGARVYRISCQKSQLNQLTYQINLSCEKAKFSEEEEIMTF